MSQALFIVDAFTTNGPFTGNPAAVCLLEQEKSAQWMQQVAAEMNLSETAFVARYPGASGGWVLRWFTPTTEVDLCGHATLAAAHALWHSGRATDAVIEFHTRSGVLSAHRHAEGIVLDFPADFPQPLDAVPAVLAEALGDRPTWVGQGREDWLAVFESAEQVRRLQPDFRGLAALPVRGLIVTAPGDEPGIDMVSRFLAPRVGINEDPVTGSAHCLLAVYWGQRLGKTRLRAWQASARTGLLNLDWQGKRVYLSGQAHITLTGEFHG